MQFFIDYAYAENHTMTLIGWAVPGEKEGKLSYEVKGADGAVRELLFLSSSRPDIGYSLFRDPDRKDLGYFLRFPYEKGETVTLRITETANGMEVASETRSVSQKSIETKNRLRRMKRQLSAPIALAKKVKRKLFRAEEKEYRDWFFRHRSGRDDLEAQKKTVFSHAPKISVVVPMFRTDRA
ncbi:MAG: hypothetical protein IK088_04495, partial [Lachnospiraceae bacterium]|nr:hypothetical protein [Lachnospiraceae bacterium]